MKRILLIIGGGIAAYKSLDLIRRLREQGYSVRCIITSAGQQFVTPLSVAALSEQPVFTELFSLKDETEIGHIQLSRQADLLVVCPATADLIARMAQGHANDLASTVLLATDKPVMVVPAMNVRMWGHKATQRNLAQLHADGVTVVGPAEGPMACGEYGPGRLVEVADIVSAINARCQQGPLIGRHIVVTAGPTHEPIDPVRYIANRSSGKQGFAIARALAELGARVSLIAGPVGLPTPAGVSRIDVESAREMHAAVRAALPADAAICVAAVADWRTEATQRKIKKDGSGRMPELQLIENPDILADIAKMKGKKRPGLVVGFAAETDKVLEHAAAKLKRKGCDWIVANDVSSETGIMGGDRTTIHLLNGHSQSTQADISKSEAARWLAQKIADSIGEKP